MGTGNSAVKAWGWGETRVKGINGGKRGTSETLSTVNIHLKKSTWGKSNQKGYYICPLSNLCFYVTE